MKVAVLSGKGGAGKTLVAANLAASMAPSRYLDCDVEEPNGHLFFHSDSATFQFVSVQIPVVDADRCTLCRTCVDFCAFNALAVVGEKVLVMDNLCKSCGGCAELCPSEAISERPLIIGGIRSFTDAGVRFDGGETLPGVQTGVPIVKAVVAQAAEANDGPVFIDCAPGTACGVMEGFMDADFCVLVAEPTVFGLSNLGLAVELVRHFGKPHGVVVNKDTTGADPVGVWCAAHDVPVLGRVPFDNTIARLSAAGRLVARESTEHRALFTGIMARIETEVAACASC